MIILLLSSTERFKSLRRYPFTNHIGGMKRKEDICSDNKNIRTNGKGNEGGLYCGIGAVPHIWQGPEHAAVLRGERI